MSSTARQIWTSPEPVRLAVVGTKRSGHHAVLSWAVSDWLGTTLHLNACSIRDGNRMHFGGFIYENGSLDRSIKHQDGPLRYNNLVISIEGVSYERAKSYLTKWRPSHTVFVIRDPFNAFASYRNKWRRRKPPKNQWLSHAKAFLDGKGLVAGSEWVDYNRWYYQNIDGLPAVHTAGKGSSFDGSKKDPRRMDVMRRWRHYAGDAEWRVAALDKDVVSAAQKIWPQLTGEVSKNV